MTKIDGFTFFEQTYTREDYVLKKDPLFDSSSYGFNRIITHEIIQIDKYDPRLKFGTLQDESLNRITHVYNNTEGFTKLAADKSHQLIEITNNYPRQKPSSKHFSPNFQDLFDTLGTPAISYPLPQRQEKVIPDAPSEITPPEQSPSEPIRVPAPLVRKIEESLQKMGVAEERIPLAAQTITQHPVTDASVATTETATGLVLKLVQADTNYTLFCKLAADKASLEREFAFLNLAWKESYLQPITPKPLSYQSGQEYAALLTYGTQNKGIVPPESLAQYTKLRRKILSSFADKYNLNLSTPATPHYIDIFDTALVHALMKKHKSHPEFQQPENSLLLSAEKLEERASTSTDLDLFKEWRALVRSYGTLVAQIQDTDLSQKESIMLIDADAREENLFPSNVVHLRPRGDRGLVRTAHPIYELAKKISPHCEMTVDTYCFMRSAIEREIGEEYVLPAQEQAAMQRVIRPLQAVNMLRTTSFKLARGSHDDAKKYLEFAKRSLTALPTRRQSAPHASFYRAAA